MNNEEHVDTSCKGTGAKQPDRKEDSKENSSKSLLNQTYEQFKQVQNPEIKGEECKEQLNSNTSQAVANQPASTESLSVDSKNKVKDLIKMQLNKSDSEKKVDCINNKKASIFQKGPKILETFYECANPLCFNISLMCKNCIDTCHKDCITYSRKKDVLKDNAECGCGLKNHEKQKIPIKSDKEKEKSNEGLNTTDEKKQKTSEQSQKPLTTFLEHLNFNLWAKRKADNKGWDTSAVCQEKSAEHRTTTEDAATNPTADVYNCIYCCDNCDNKSDIYEKEEVANQHNLHCKCCEDNLHDSSLIMKKLLESIASEQTINYDKFVLIGKVFFNYKMFKEEFKEFRRTNKKIKNIENKTNNTTDPLENIKFTKGYLQVVQFMTDFKNLSKNVVFDISRLNMYQLKTFNFEFLSKLTRVIAENIINNSYDVACFMLPKMLSFFSCYYISPKIRIKHVKMIFKHRDNISPLHRYFFKDPIDRLYKLMKIDKDQFNNFMDHLNKIIKNLLMKREDSAYLADIIKQYLKLLKLQLYYRIGIDLFNQICNKILSILICYKDNKILQFSKYENKENNEVNNEQYRKEEEMSPQGKLNKCIRRIMPLLVVGLNDIQFEQKVFDKKEFPEERFIFQMGDIQKVIMQIIFYSDKKNFSGLYIYHMTLMNSDSYIDNINYLLKSEKNLFQDEFFNIYKMQFSQKMYAEKADDLFNKYENIKKNYFLGPKLKKYKDTDPLHAMNLFAEDLSKEINSFLGIEDQENNGNLCNENKENQENEQNKLYERQLCLMKGGYMEIIFDMFKLITTNSYFSNTFESETTPSLIFKLILEKILPPLVQDNPFLASLFFSTKIVCMFFSKANIKLFFNILDFYSLLLKSINKAKIKLNVKFVLEKITKMDNFDNTTTDKKPKSNYNNNYRSSVTIKILKRMFEHINPLKNKNNNKSSDAEKTEKEEKVETEQNNSVAYDTNLSKIIESESESESEELCTDKNNNLFLCTNQKKIVEVEKKNNSGAPVTNPNKIGENENKNNNFLCLSEEKESFNLQLKKILQIYHELLCVTSDYEEIYVNDMIVQVVKKFLKDEDIKEVFHCYLVDLNNKKENGSYEEVVLKIFQILNSLSNNYFYLINKHIPTEDLESYLVLYDKLNPNSRMIIQELYIRHKLKFPYKIEYDWKITYEKNFDGEDKCFLLQKPESPSQNNSELNESDETKFENFKKLNNEFEIVKGILENFKRIISFYEKDYFPNDKIEFHLKFFRNVVLSTSLNALYKIIYFNKELNNMHKYYIYYICYLFQKCLKDTLEYLNQYILNKRENENKFLLNFSDNRKNIEEMIEKNKKINSLSDKITDLFNKVHTNIEKIEKPEKYIYMNHIYFIDIFSDLSSKYEVIELRFNEIFNNNNSNEVKINKNSKEAKKNNTGTDFYTSAKNFYESYQTKKKDKGNNIMHAILDRKSDDELYKTLKIKIVDDLVDKLSTYAKRKEIKLKEGVKNVNGVVGYDSIIGTGLRDIFMVVKETMALDPEVYQKNIIEKNNNTAIVQKEFVSLITIKIPYLMQYVLLEFSNNVIDPKIPFIELFNDMLQLLENMCDNNDVFTIFVSKSKIEELGPARFEDLLMIFLLLILQNLNYYNNKKYMLEKLNKENPKSNFFNIYIENIFRLVGKLVKESKIPLYRFFCEEKSDAEKEQLNPEIWFNLVKKKSKELMRTFTCDNTFFKFIYNYVLFLDVISFEYDAEIDVDIREVQNVLIKCYKTLFPEDPINKTDGIKQPALCLLGEFKKAEDSKEEETKAEDSKEEETNAEDSKKEKINKKKEIFTIMTKIYIFVQNMAELKGPKFQKFRKFINNIEKYSNQIDNKEDENAKTLGQIFRFFKEIVKNVEIVYYKNIGGDNSSLEKSKKTENIIDEIKKYLYLNESEENCLKSKENNKKKIELPLQIYFISPYDGLRLDEETTKKHFMDICKFHEGFNKNLSFLLDYYTFLNIKVKIMAKESDNQNQIYKFMNLIKESTPLEYISAVFTVLTNLSVLLSIYYNNPLDPKNRTLVNPFYYFTICIDVLHLLFLAFSIGVLSYREYTMYNLFNEEITKTNLADQNENTKIDYFENFANKKIYPLAWNFIFGFIGILHKKLNFLFSVQMFSLFYLFGTMKAAIFSVQSKYGQFLSAGFLILIFILFYSLISVMFFQDKFFNSDLQENMCDTVFQCILSLLSNGIRSGAGLGFSITSPSDPYYWTEFLFEWVFYFSIILIMLNIINGIIVDTFQSMRNKNTIDEKKKNNLCYICYLSRNEFEANGKDFKSHWKNDHNIFSYMLFIMRIRNSEEKDLNSAEIYVKQKIEKARTDFFPIKKSRSLKK